MSCFRMMKNVMSSLLRSNGRMDLPAVNAVTIIIVRVKPHIPAGAPDVKLKSQLLRGQSFITASSLSTKRFLLLTMYVKGRRNFHPMSLLDGYPLGR